MKFHSFNLLPLLLLTLLAALTFWLERATQVDEGGSNGKLRHDPDFIVDNFTMRHFNSDGSLQHALSAGKMLHYPDDDSTEVTAPSLTYIGQSVPLHLTADQARISRNGKEIRLSSHVRLLREASANSPELLMTTEEMLAYPDDELARGNKPVTITQGSSVVNGQGLEANNREHTYKLLGRVQGSIYRTRTNQP